MISGVIIHLDNEMPVVVDLEEMPGAADEILRCTNVRTIDGKRPAFVHDRNSVFLVPLRRVRMVEVPQTSDSAALVAQEPDEQVAPEPADELEAYDEEAEEDLLARIRQI